MKTEPNLPSSEPDALIVLKDVEVSEASEPGHCLIKDWDWRINENEFWVLGGMAGAGKTQLLSVAAGLNKPKNGLLKLFGKEVQQLDPESWLEEKLRLGIVFEDGGRVFQDLSVFENLMLPLSYHELDEADKNHAWVFRVLERMGMQSMSNRLAGRLSRNWRQRLGLARAMVLRPDVLFLDNPLGVVDSHHGQWWLDFLDSMMGGEFEWKPRSLVVSANDLTPWMGRADCLGLIHESRWIVMDPAQVDELSKSDLIRALSTGIKQSQ